MFFIKRQSMADKDLQEKDCIIEQLLKTVVYENQSVLFHEYTNCRRLLLMSESAEEPSETA